MVFNLCIVRLIKELEGIIRQTEGNKRRLATLVREGFLCLNGKRYYNPLIKDPEPNEEVAVALLQMNYNFMQRNVTNQLSF